jgi:two-component SAPR family response regulator
MEEKPNKEQNPNPIVKEPAALTYGMSSELRDSDLLVKIQDLSHEDKRCLIRFIHETDTVGFDEMDDLDYDLNPYTMDELNSRIDEAEKEIERGEGKSFDEMMNGFRRELLWLK